MAKLKNLENLKRQCGRVSSVYPDPIFQRLIEAYQLKDITAVEELLKNGLPVNYREPTKANRTPLLYAVKFDFVEAIDVLLQKGADCSLADDAGVTPLHSASINGCVKSVQRLLQAGANPNTRDFQGKTPLHYVTRSTPEVEKEKSASTTVVALLNAGASTRAADKKGRIPLHIAAAVGNVPVMQVLFKMNACLVTARDKDNHTPLHLAVIGGSSLKAVKLLLKFQSQIDAQDNKGRTPLHYVAARPINNIDEEFDRECLEMLLLHGASVAVEDDEGHNALSLALQKTMWWNRQSSRDSILHSVKSLVDKGSVITDGFDMWRMVETFPSLAYDALNKSIRTNTSARDSPYFELKLDFRPLTANSQLLNMKALRLQIPISSIDESPIPTPLLDDNEVAMLHYIVYSGHKCILTHPLCSIFLHLKWLKIRKYLLANVIFYFMFVLTFTNFVLRSRLCVANLNVSSHLFNFDHQNWNDTGDHHVSYSDFDDPYSRILLFVFSISLIVREIVQLLHSPLFYIKHIENFLDISILIGMLILLFWTRKEYQIRQFERNMVSLLAVLAWSRLMLILGQFPSCGVYIVMFSTVFQTVVKFLALYIPLLIAFALGLFLIFGEAEYFKEFPISIMTTMVMMTGELEYGDKILKNPLLEQKLYPCVLLFLFILMVHIILSNLLIALAVNDLRTIQQRSEILRLTRQVELLVTVETFLHSLLIPAILQFSFIKRISVFNGRTDATISIYPNVRYSCVEKIFSCLVKCFGCRSFFIKIFEKWIVNFIPPEPVCSIPKILINEALLIALTEFEVQKRDKRYATKLCNFKELRKKDTSKYDDCISPLEIQFDARETYGLR